MSNFVHRISWLSFIIYLNRTEINQGSDVCPVEEVRQICLSITVVNSLCSSLCRERPETEELSSLSGPFRLPAKASTQASALPLARQHASQLAYYQIRVQLLSVLLLCPQWWQRCRRYFQHDLDQPASWIRFCCVFERAPPVSGNELILNGRPGSRLLYWQQVRRRSGGGITQRGHYYQKRWTRTSSRTSSGSVSEHMTCTQQAAPKTQVRSCQNRCTHAYRHQCKKHAVVQVTSHFLLLRDIEF